MSSSAAPRWVPLESNPEVMTKYNRTLGAAAGEWVDVYGFDDDLLQMVPQPVLAVILLFPISEGYDNYCKKIDEDLVAKRQNVVPDGLFYMRQTVQNACGTVGVIHSLLNNVNSVNLEDGVLKNFLQETSNKSPQERAEALEHSDGIASSHEIIASEGQTEAPNRDENLVTHFVAFVQNGGVLYELDGRRKFPVNHGPSSAETLLKDAAKVCQERIQWLDEHTNGNEYRFTVVALTTGTID